MTENTIQATKYSPCNTRLLPAGADQPLRQLARAVIIRAAKDARDPDELDSLLARLWLLSDDCSDYCDLAGLNFSSVVFWIVGGCKPWRKQKAMKLC